MLKRQTCLPSHLISQLPSLQLRQRKNNTAFKVTLESQQTHTVQRTTSSCLNLLSPVMDNVGTIAKPDRNMRPKYLPRRRASPVQRRVVSRREPTWPHCHPQGLRSELSRPGLAFRKIPIQFGASNWFHGCFLVVRMCPW